MTIAATYPLCSAQMGLWLAYQMDTTTLALLAALRYRVLGPLDPERLRRAIGSVTAASDALRTFFGCDSSGGPVQHVRATVHPTFRVVSLPPDADPGWEERTAWEWETQPFDIERGVLFDTLVIRRSPTNWLWLTRFSHLLVDGVATSLYIAAVTQAYRQLPEDATPAVGFVGNYMNHIAAEQQLRQGAQWALSLRYWQEQHAQPTAAIFSPGRGTAREHRRVVAHIDRETYREFEKACAEDGVSTPVGMLAIIAATVARHHQRDDFSIGVASHNRLSEHRTTVGMFSGYLPLRAGVDRAQEGVQLAKTLDARLRAGLQHRQVPARDVVAASVSQLFDLVFSHVRSRESFELDGTRLSNEGGFACDPSCVFLLIVDLDDHLPVQVNFTWRPDLTDGVEARAFLDQFVRLVARWPALRKAPIETWPLMDAPTLALIKRFSAGPQRTVGPERDVLRRFRDQVARHPGAVAIMDEAGSHTYRAMLNRSLACAALLHKQGVRAGDTVGVRLERSADLVSTLLGALHLGAAYLPLDLSIPSERAAYMLENSGAALLVTRAGEVPGTRAICIETLDGDMRHDFVPHIEGDQLAYVLYTSGSTGKPKGVQISRAALANVIASFEDELGTSPNDVMLSTTGISFDIFGLELFLPLACGATLVLADRDRLLEQGYVADLARTHGPSLFQATPSLLRNLLDIGWRPRDTMRILVGGEAVGAELVGRLRDAREVINVYGPTEATIWASFERIQPDPTTPPPIGRPLWNTQLHVLDARLELVPPGVSGELYIGGAQLARGYAGRPDLTAERFLPDPFEPGQRIYRTGDLARWRADGHLEYLGRADQQVKINGHRIEPAEIETVLSGHPAIASAAVVPRDDLPGGTQLIGYFTTAPGWEQHAGAEAMTRRQTDEWQAVYDRSYASASGSGDIDSVWTNSFTGLPYSAEEMREWTEATVQRLAAFGAKRMLEVGCGSGLLLRPLAPLAQRYVGTDLSVGALQLLRNDAALPAQVELRQLAADAIDAFADEAFDLVVINSVAQYFPGASYLRDVVAKALALLAPGGRLFVGDVRNLSLLPAFHAAIELQTTQQPGDAETLRERVQARCDEERELCISPALFEELAQTHGLQAVQLLGRRGVAATEMNEFRFDAVLRQAAPGLASPVSVSSRLEWTEDGADALAAVLRAPADAPFTLRGVPDARVWSAVCALRGHAGDAQAAVHPEQLHAQAGERWHVLTQPSGKDGTFDALFVPAHMDPDDFRFPGADAGDDAPLANEPMRPELMRTLQRLLREHLSVQLPEYMVPTIFVPLLRLPTNTSGKLDRGALPRPVAEAPASDVAVADGLEAAVAHAMAEVLALSSAPGRQGNFFQLGGHSLAAARLAARLRESQGAEVTLRDVMENPTVQALAARMRVGETRTTPQIGRGTYNDGEAVPLSHAQEALWFLDRLQGPGATYNIPSALRVSGTIDPERLSRSLAMIVERHTVLRTVYAERDGHPVATLLPAPEAIAVQVEAVADDLYARLSALTQRSFDLARDLVLRAGLFTEADGTQVLALVIHHIAADALSCRLIWDELRACYETLGTGHLPAAQPVLQYADFARWQRERVAGGELTAQRDWWRGHLADAPESLDLPCDHPRGKAANQRGATHAFTLEAALRTQLEVLASRLGITPFAVLLGGYAGLLARLSGQPEVIVGVPAANRQQQPGLANVVGAFMNTLPLRLACDAPSAAALVTGTYEVLKLALHNGEWPFDELVRDLGLRRATGRNPLFQTLFTFLEQEEPTSFAGLPVAAVTMPTGGARCDLTLRVIAQADGSWQASFEFDRELFEPATIERWSGHLICLLRSLAADDAATHPLELELMDSSQQRELLGWGTGQAAADAPDVVGLIEAQALRNPHAIAVVSGEARLSYAELDAASSQLALHLRSLGVRGEDVVGVHMDRGTHLVIAMLGALKAGATYLPLDMSLPKARLAQVLRASRAKVLVGTQALLAESGCEGIVSLALDQLKPSVGERAMCKFVRPEAASAAYMIYTSGSTGEPKGVQVSRGSLAAFVRALTETIGIHEDDRNMSVASISFDMFMSEVVPFLCAGARVVFADRGQMLDHGYAARLCAQEAVTCAIMTPSLARNLVAQGWRPAASFRMMTGGEPLSRELAQQLCEFATVWNRYGPTEATIAQTARRLQMPLRSAPTIGRPFRGSRMYVLDKRMNPVPVGVAGELYIGGVQLARGYFGRPELTADRFLASPFEAGERIYRTGDLARWNADGELEHLGRCDRQVKIRGYRIELGEIEAVLLRQGSLRAAAVVPREATCGDVRLVAYVVPADGVLATAALRAHAQAQLPAYMAPAAYVALERLPANRNGKLDLGALPMPQWDAGAVDTAGGVDDLERAVAATMGEVLGASVPARDADFFGLGGHSLTAVRLLATIRREHGIDVAIKSFFDKPTVAGLAALLRDRAGQDSTSLLVDFGGIGKLPLFLVHGGDGSAMNLRLLAERLRDAAHVRGIDSTYLCGIAPHPHLSMRELADLYADHVDSVVPPGNALALGGWSFGGAVAFEMARELRRRGYHVAACFAIDAGPGANPTRPRDDAGAVRAMLARQLADAGHAPADIGLMLEDTHPGSFLARLTDIYAAHKAAADGYEPRPAEGDFTLVTARDSAWPEAWLLNAWADCVDGRFTHRVVEGDHWSVLREPHVDALAREILGLLHPAQQRAAVAV